ncbi:MAG: T9SS type A sorting domain-containing protein, partial [bacterium]
ADSGAIVICRNDSLTFTDTTNEYGYFEFSSVYALGEWQIIVSKSGYADTALIVDLTGRSSYSLNFALYPYAYLYVSDFEANNGGLNVVGSSSDWEWGTPTVGPPSAHSGMKLWATKLNSNYSNNSNSILQLPPIVLPDWSNPKLKFWHWYSFEYSSSTGRYYDGGNVKISVDGGAYNVITPIGGYNCTIYSSNPYLGGERAFGGSSNGWREVIFDLLSYVGHTITIRIHFGSDAYTRYPGWYIDDVMVVSPDYSLAISEPFYEKPLSLSISSIYPNPFNSSFKIKLNGIKGEKRIEIFLYDVLGREVMRSEFAPTELISIDFSSRRSINLSSGVYLLRIKQGESETTAKVIYLR